MGRHADYLRVIDIVGALVAAQGVLRCRIGRQWFSVLVKKDFAFVVYKVVAVLHLCLCKRNRERVRLDQEFLRVADLVTIGRITILVLAVYGPELDVVWLWICIVCITVYILHFRNLVLACLVSEVTECKSAEFFHVDFRHFISC